jgi:hypothetical protein
MQQQDRIEIIDIQHQVYLVDEFCLFKYFISNNNILYYPPTSSRRSKATAMNTLGTTLLGT